MTTVKDIFDLLATGELSNLKLRQDHTNSLSEEDYPKVINHINLGLLEIYKRFNLLKNELKLHICPGLETYYLRPDRVATIKNMDSDTYIEQPNSEEVTFNIIRLLHVFDDLGSSLPINDRHSDIYIQTIAHDTLKIKPVEEKQVLSLLFQVSYPKIVLDDDFEPDEYELYIPEFILDPLIKYISARIYKPMGGNSSTADADKSIGYMQEYELACQKIESFGLDDQVNDERPNFVEGGWK